MPLRPLPALSDNYVWTLTGPDGGALVVDPGEAGPVLQAAAEGLRPAAILLTHHHADHIAGTAELLDRWPEIPVVAPSDGRITPASRRVEDGEELALAGFRLRVLAVPGHTRSHVAYHVDHGEGQRWLFCGDTLFSLGCGRLFEGTAAQMHASLGRLAALPADTQVCCGHEYTLANAAFARVVEPDNPALARRIEEAQAMRDDGRPTLPSRLADELAANPFLRVAQPAVRAAVAARLGREPADGTETFAELRRWKDGFRS
ncbi:MAG TPA: hydroxyacylglutathione hydrolase [Lysobacter sp.]|nr:hydroxyacylglutathione hydrolase [Lysobacter sp.]